MSGDSDATLGSQSPPQQPIVSAESEMDKDILGECIQLRYAKVIAANIKFERRDGQILCLNMPEPLGEDQLLLMEARNLDATEDILVRTAPFPIGDGDECKDNECLELQTVNFMWSLDEDDYPYFIRNIQGAKQVFIKSGESPLILGRISVLSAIDEVDIDKMGELGKKKKCLLLRDIVDTLPDGAFERWPEHGQSFDLTLWLSKSFGRSSAGFNVTGYVPRKQFGQSYTHRREEHLCLFQGVNGEKCSSPPFSGWEQIICVSKVDEDEVTEDILKKSVAADPVTIASQFKDVVIQNPCMSHVFCVSIGCALFYILKATVKMMRPKRARRRIMRPQAAMVEQNGMSTANQEDAVYTMMSDAI